MYVNGTSSDPGLSLRVHGDKENASFQIIVLGPNGGPREDTITGMLVRAPQSQWRRGSMIAVDAGAHLASITRILQQHMPLYSREIPPPGYSKELEQGPFAGITLTGFSARANALQIFRELMHAFLITHPHLDHMSAMALNTPALEYGREAKTIVALGTTIEAIKTHIFNDWIWPNLSDEGSGVGFVTYRRLQEGGHQRLGSGDQRGYVRVADSLMTMCLPVTHGKCKPRPALAPHDRNDSDGWHENYMQHRRLSRISDHGGYFASTHGQSSFSMPYSAHMMPGQLTPGGYGLHTPGGHDLDHMFEPVKSSAFFILNEDTSNEILIFGDIEPDSVSMTPLNIKVWRTAAPKIANGTLKAIFIECSYDDSVRDADLYGHLCPRHLINELTSLGKEVAEHIARSKQKAAVHELSDQPGDYTQQAKPQVATNGQSKRKQKQSNHDTSQDQDFQVSTTISVQSSSHVGTRSNKRRKPSYRLDEAASSTALRDHSPSRSSRHVHFSGNSAVQARTGSNVAITSPTLHSGSPMANMNTGSMQAFPYPYPSTDHEDSHPVILDNPLEGLVVHIIHVKDTMTDGPSPGEIILKQLKQQAEEIQLGCDFDITDFGESIWV